MKDALKGYLALASGLTEVTRQRATAAAKALVAQGEATAGQVSGLADDLVSQSRSNREAVAALVKYEVDRALGRVGLASSDEVGELTGRVRALETAVRELSQQIGPATPSATGRQAAGQSDAPEGATAKPAAATKGPGKPAPAQGRPAKGAKAPVQPSAALASTTAAANTVAPPRPASKATAGKAPARQASIGASSTPRTATKKSAGAAAGGTGDGSV